MSLDLKSIDDISAADIEALIQAPEREGQRLEFKRELPGSLDGDKKEFLADVSAFANAGGGDIVYGIEAASGEAVRVVPLSGNADGEILRLENVARTGLDPRILNLKLRPIPVEGGHVLIVRIPRSWAGPHVVTHGGTFRFFARTSAGKQPLDVRELRDLFALSESIELRVRNFRADRVARIAARDEGISLAPGPCTIVHVLPFGPSNLRELDARSIKPDELRPLESWGRSWRYNLDGFLVFWPGDDGVLSYVQLFRDGRIEMADAYLLSRSVPARENGLPAELLETRIIEGVTGAVAAQERLGVTAPLVVLVTIVGVKGYSLTPQGTRDPYTAKEHVIDRGTLLLPEVVIHETPFDPATGLKPVFDALWNAANWPGSRSYGASGERMTT